MKDYQELARNYQELAGDYSRLSRLLSTILEFLTVSFLVFVFTFSDFLGNLRPSKTFAELQSRRVAGLDSKSQSLDSRLFWQLPPLQGPRKQGAFLENLQSSNGVSGKFRTFLGNPCYFQWSPCVCSRSPSWLSQLSQFLQPLRAPGVFSEMSPISRF